MNERITSRMARLLSGYQRRRESLGALALASLFIMFGVAMILHNNGVAATHTEQVLDCQVSGTYAHTHDESCYDANGVLVCPLPEIEKHVHTDECYTETSELACGIEEHVHDAGCYDSEGNLVCELPEHEHTDACYRTERVLTCGQDEVTEEHVHGPGCFKSVEVSDGDDNQTDEGDQPEDVAITDDETVPGMPAQKFAHTIKDQDDYLVLRIDVDAPEGALPEGTVMTANWVDTGTLTVKQQTAVADAVSSISNGVIYDQQAVDIRFADATGAEVKPARDVVVTFTSALLDTQDLPVAACIKDLSDKELKAQEDALREGRTAEEAEPKRHADALDRLSDKTLGKLGLSLSDNQTAVATGEPATFVLNVTTRAHSMRCEGEDVRVDVEAPAEAGLPADAELRVAEVAPGTEEYANYENVALSATGTDMAKLSRFFDIKIVRADGTEVEPKVPVKVKIKLADAPAGEPSSVVHFQDGGEAGYYPEVIPAEVNNLTTKFDAESFSVYGVMYAEELRTYVIADGGNTYEVIVTYDSTAKIPEGAELRVQKLKKADEAYAAFQENAAANLDGAEGIPAKPLLLDIAIVANGEEVEPAEGSEVKVEVRLVNGAVEGMFTGEDSPILVNDMPLMVEDADLSQALQVVHQANDGSIETVETADTIAAGGMVTEFTTDSFSDWLLFLDEDATDIYLDAGDTLTLRPYTEWIWKTSDLPAEYTNPRANWTFPDTEWRQGSSQSEGQWRTSYTSTTSGSGSNVFHERTYEDEQLNETYTLYYSDTLNEGEFDIHTNKGKTIHIHVGPAQEAHKPKVIEGLPGLTVNLFDYDVPTGSNGQEFDFTRSGNLDSNNVTANNPTTNTVNGPLNGLNRDLKFVGWGSTNSGDQNWFWINNYTQDDPNQGIVKSTLNANGYPELTPSRGGVERGLSSLQYLFDPTAKGHDVYAFPNVGGLFQRDNLGYYYYNSNTNYAEFNQQTNQFVLYEHTYAQRNVSNNVRQSTAKPIGFFPFHEYDTGNPPSSINHNKDLNHHFGMTMSVDFEIPADRRAPDDDGYKHDIIYEFSGDDDLWVFIDDELALDIGGIHQPVTGQINFTTGEITVHGVDEKTMNFTVGAHTLKMYYIERGGCDSNLSVRFNLPLILGVGNITIRKQNATKDANLAGAVFGVWDNPTCTGDPYTVATSDDNGLVIKNLPIREENKNYYLQEMVPPEGYVLDKTIYTLVPEKGTDGQYRFKVLKDGEEIESGIGAGPSSVDQTAYPVITNEEAKAIEVGVQKVWENADGTPLDPDIQSATFTLKRRRLYSPEHSHLIRVNLMSFERGENNAPVLLDQEPFDQIYATPDDVLTITYKHAATNDDSHNVPGYPGEVLAMTRGGAYETAVWLPVAADGAQQSVNYTVNEAHVNNGEIDLWVDKAFTDWCDGYYYSRGENPHFTGFGAHAHTLITEKDPDFEESIVVTKASGWRGVREDLPVFRKFQDGEVDYYYYEYYVEETDVPEGFEVIYYSGNTPTSGTTSPDTNQTGDFTVVNRKLLDVPIEKEWADFGGDSYTWTATFQLEQMEVKVNESDPDATDAITHFTAVAGRTLTVTKGQNPQPAFTNLPMYRAHSNGTVYRILYSVNEISYTVTRTGDNVIVAQWSEDGTLETIGDKRYEPIFEQDAGEHGSSVGDYEIVVINELENRKLFKSLDLSVEKEWPEGSEYAAADDTFADFVLRRYVHEEYRDYSGYDGNDWVTIEMDTGNYAVGTTPIIESITVPRGTTIHLVGEIKPNTNANSIVFTQSSGEESITLTRNNPNPTPETFDITFVATQDKTVSLARGDIYVVGGRDGFRMTDTYDGKTTDERDASFAEDFRLNKANNWKKLFEYLPQVEEQDVDPKTGAQTIYVYSYYLEEVNSNPADFSANFTGVALSFNNEAVGDSIAIGTEDNRIDSDMALTAENVQSTIDATVRKVDKKNVAVPNAPTLEGAAFKIVKYTSGDYQGKDTSWGTQGEKVMAEKSNPKGEFTVEGLTAGYYEIVETEVPDGYVKMSENPHVLVRLNSTTKKLEVVLLNASNQPIETNVSDMVVIDLTTDTPTITVGNTPGAELPHSGGRGVQDIYATGIAMIAGAMAYLLSRRMRKSA